MGYNFQYTGPTDGRYRVFIERKSGSVWSLGCVWKESDYWVAKPSPQDPAVSGFEMRHEAAHYLLSRAEKELEVNRLKPERRKR